jgi:hypothetical protein
VCHTYFIRAKPVSSRVDRTASGVVTTTSNFNNSGLDLDSTAQGIATKPVKQQDCEDVRMRPLVLEDDITGSGVAMVHHRIQAGPRCKFSLPVT